LRVIIVVVQVGAVKIHVAAIEALRKNGYLSSVLDQTQASGAVFSSSYGKLYHVGDVQL
jgi:hypothetical protein